MDAEIELARLKTELLCYGIRVTEKIYPKNYPAGGKSRAGVAGSGRNFILNPSKEQEAVVNIGVLQPFLERSPFEFRDGWIYKNSKKVCQATIRQPYFHFTPYGEILRLHGKSSLAIALTNRCIFKSRRKGCMYCIIDIGKKEVTHEQEKIKEALKKIEEYPELRRYRDTEGKEGIIEIIDINVNSGSLISDEMVKFYVKAIKAMKKVSELPIGIQILPIQKEGIENLYSAGTDEISFNMEIFSEEERRKIIPEKNKMFSREKYLKALEDAVEIFQKNNVESWILIGLEPIKATIEGIKAITNAGAISLPKPFRPLYGSALQDHPVPAPISAMKIYEAWYEITKRYGLNPLRTKAGCGRCGACFPTREIFQKF